MRSKIRQLASFSSKTWTSIEWTPCWRSHSIARRDELIANAQAARFGHDPHVAELAHQHSTKVERYAFDPAQDKASYLAVDLSDIRLAETSQGALERI